MHSELYFRVLGPVAVERDGEPVELGGSQRRTVLSVLLLDADRVVSVERLVDALWGEHPPASFRVQLQSLVSELRRTLGVGGVRASAPIETCAPGYRLRVSPDRLDLAEFRREVMAARSRIRAGEPAAAADLLHTALARWRGEAFADISCRYVRQATVGLAEMRLAALEDRVDVDIAARRHGELIPELQVLVREHPLRERFYGQLMTVLAGAGRLADALAVYRDARQQMVEELGIEPSIGLQQLHRAILTGATGVDTADAMPDRPYVVPRQLPSDLPDLVDREELLLSAGALLAETPRVAPACVAITGPGGIGKTAFALRLAHRQRERYIDGQLYARLGGTTASGRLESGEVLAMFLGALGVPLNGVPRGLDERAALFRELLAARRVLVVLDDVADEAQLRPLLPAEPRCGVLVTSRRRLAGVEILRTVPLAGLPVVSGVELLRRVAGPARVDAEPIEAVETVRHCGGLPLAIRIAAARLASRPNWTVADMARRLASHRDRLDWLQQGDLGVRASFHATCVTLSSDQRRLFRRLGLLNISEFPAWLPAALLDDRADAAERLLNDLVDVHLVEPAERGVTGPRYRVHDLIHLLARELSAEEDAAERRAALGRALDGWRDLAATADTELPDWYGVDPEPEPAWRAPEQVREAVRAAPFTWFDEERSVLFAQVRLAADERYPNAAWPLAQRLKTYLDMRGQYDELAVALGQGWRAAEQAGDLLGRACMLRGLVSAEAYLDHVNVAIQYAERAVAAYVELGDEPEDEGTRGRTQHRTGRPEWRNAAPEVVDLTKALTDARHRGDTLDVGLAAYSLCLARRRAGEHGGYLALIEEACEAFRTCGARVAELWALQINGLAYLKQRRFDDAIGRLLRAHAIVDELGSDVEMVNTSGDIILVYAAHGRFEEAEALARDALKHARVQRHRWDEGRALETMGALNRARGDHHAAIDALMKALAVWRRLGVANRITHTLNMLAEHCDEIGDANSAAFYRNSRS